VVILLSLLALSPSLCLAVEILPFSEITAGMRGKGRTVFQGSRIEEFDVEIIGTMEEILPRKNLILAKLSGGPLSETGILEGMSGSPIYVDGKLVGAVAYSWGFATQPICGITPIEEMLEVFDRGLGLPEGTADAWIPSDRTGTPAPASLLFHPDKMVEFLLRGPARSPLASPGAGGASLQPIRPTLTFSGFEPGVAQRFFPVFEAMSMRPVLAGPPASAEAKSESSRTSLEPGSAFGVKLVRGDLDVTAIGTVTYVEGDKILGFGHPFLGMGPTAMPLTKAYVHGYLPSLSSSFKLAAPMEEIGAVTQDRFPGVAGRKGATVKMVPVHIELKRGDGASTTYRFDIVPDPLLTPGLLNASLLTLLSVDEKSVGDVTLRLKEGSRIQISDDLDVKLDNLFSGEQSTLYASGTVAYITYLLLNNEDRPAQIEGINLLFDYEDKRKVARIEKIWMERYTAKPGETVTVHVSLMPFRGETETLDLPLEIPAEAAEGRVLLQIGDSLTLSRMEAEGGTPFFFPRDLEHLVWLLNNIRSNQKIYATVIRPDSGAYLSGYRLPNLPPSVSSILLQPTAERHGSGRVGFRALVESSAETSYAVRGYQRAFLEIKR